jgi:hypothetical protein
MLFPAPLTRRELVQYKLLDYQKMMLPPLLFFCLFGLFQAGFPRGIYGALGFWLALTVLSLHGIGAKLTRQSLLDHGWSGLRRQAIPLAVLAAWVAIVVLGAPPLPDLGGGRMRALEAWFVDLGSSPAGIALTPFRLLARPAMAPDLGSFVVSFAALAGVGFLLFLWVLRSDVAFEESAVGFAETLSRRIEAARKGKFTVDESGKPPRRNPWRLSVEGSPEVAFLWKSVTEVLRGFSPRFLLLLGMLAVFAVPVAFGAARRMGDAGNALLATVAGVLAAGSGLLAFGGPTFLGGNLRHDLEKVEALKILPLSGARLVRASLFGTVVPIAALQCLGILGAALLLPGAGRGAIPPAWRLAAAVAGMVALPCVTALSAATDAGGALFFPSWIKPGQFQGGGGVEGMGTNIVSMLGRMAVLGAGLLIPVGIAVVATAIGGAIGPAWAPAGLLAGAAAGGAVVLAEVWALSLLLGRRFERLDPAEEGMVS